jgi:hypothetical protein
MAKFLFALLAAVMVQKKTGGDCPIGYDLLAR